MNVIQELVDIMKALRDPETGCPWDKQQTMESIVPHSLEEVYELVDAVERNSMEEIKDELGGFIVSHYLLFANGVRSRLFRF